MLAILTVPVEVVIAMPPNVPVVKLVTPKLPTVTVPVPDPGLTEIAGPATICETPN